MSPSAWFLVAFCVGNGGYFAYVALTASLAGLRVFAVASCVGILVFAWFMLSRLVMVVQQGRLWLRGRWTQIDHHGYVTLSALPWIVDLPAVVVVSRDGRTFDAGLFRFRESAAVRAGQRLADQLGVTFR